MKIKDLIQETKVEDINGVKVWVNPTFSSLKIILATKIELRGLVTKTDVYVWNAYDSTHTSMTMDLGINGKLKRKMIYISGSELLKNHKWAFEWDEMYIKKLIGNGVVIRYEDGALDDLKNNAIIASYLDKMDIKEPTFDKNEIDKLYSDLIS